MSLILQSVHTDETGLISLQLNGESARLENFQNLIAEAGDLLAFAVLKAPRAIGELDARFVLFDEDNNPIEERNGEFHNLIRVEDQIPRGVGFIVNNDQPFIIVAGILRRLRTLRTSPGQFFKCEACVQAIKAALIALLGPAVLAGEYVEPLQELVEILANELDLPIEWLNGVLRRIGVMGLDNIAFEICVRLNLCRP